jgi:hypothetical protein
MTFTSVFRSVKKGEKDNAWVSNSKWQKNSTTIVEEATKSNYQDVCSSKKTDVKAAREEALTHNVT